MTTTIPASDTSAVEPTQTGAKRGPIAAPSDNAGVSVSGAEGRVATCAVGDVSAYSSAQAERVGDGDALTTRRPRVVGIDIARGLAVLGMITAHTIFGAVDTAALRGTWLADVIGWANGRPAVMFVLLAGISLGFITGAPTPRSGREAVHARIKVFTRAAILIALASLLALLNTPIVLILAYYAVWFVLALPFVRLSARALFMTAGVMSVIGPVLLWAYGLAQSSDLIMGAPSLDGTVQSALVSGTYPGLAFLPIMLAGLGLSRLNLASLRTQVTLLVTGVLLATGAYSVAAFVYPPLVPDTVLSVQQEEAKAAQFADENQELLDKGKAAYVPDGEIQTPEDDAAFAAFAAKYQQAQGAVSGDVVANGGVEGQDPRDEAVLDAAPNKTLPADTAETGEDFGPAPSFTHWSYLLQAKPHTGMPMDVAGCVGVALAVLALCLMAPRWLTRLLAPVAAVGSMSLTAYTLQVVAIGVYPTFATSTSPMLAAVLIAGVTLACWVWAKTMGRGPLERFMAWAAWRASSAPVLGGRSSGEGALTASLVPAAAVAPSGPVGGAVGLSGGTSGPVVASSSNDVVAASPVAKPRIGGIDIARGLAVLGMITAHTLLLSIDEPSDGSLWSSVIKLSDGRPAVMFVLLAGVSLGILTGRPTPYDGERAVTARLRVLSRSVVLFLVTGVLAALGTPVALILGYYAVWFALALPFARLRARTLVTVAAVGVVVGPFVVWCLRNVPILGLNSLGGGEMSDALQTALVWGVYPGLAYMNVVLVGLAISRLDLMSRRVQRRLLAVGTAMAVFGYGVAEIAKRVFGSPTAYTSLTSGSASGSGVSLGGAASLSGGVSGMGPEMQPQWSDLLGATPHTATTLEMVAAGGVAIAVLALCLMAPRWLEKALAPIAAVGSMALTAYSGHVVVIWLFPSLVGDGVIWQPALFLVGLTVACWVWKVVAGRGPLERFMAWVSRRVTAPSEPVRWA